MTALEIPYSPSLPAEINCRLCGAPARFVFQQTVLKQWEAGYYQCAGCDLIQTNEPTWIKEAYSSAITAMDTGAIERNRLTAELTTVVAWILRINAQSRCLDFGGGNGVFARMMRDRGFNFWLHDRHAQNIFARGFEASPDQPFSLVTAFEVFEHLADVNQELENLFAPQPQIVLVSTQLHRGPDQNWWYNSPETGQHVAFYSHRTMKHIANRFGYSVTGSRAYTLFVRRDVALFGWRVKLAQRLVSNSKGNATNICVRGLLKFGPNFSSRTGSDNQAIKLMQL